MTSVRKANDTSIKDPIDKNSTTTDFSTFDKFYGSPKKYKSRGKGKTKPFSYFKENK